MRSFPLLLLSTLLVVSCQASSTISSSTVPPPPTADTVVPTAELRNTRWVLRQLNGQAVPAPTNAEPYVLLRSTELSAEGNGSCNRFHGPFALRAEGLLRFGELASTRMGCASPTDNDTEKGFMRALAATRTYRISGDTLRLFGEAAAPPVAVLHAVYLR